MIGEKSELRSKSQFVVSAYAVEFVEQDDAANNFWGITFPPIASRAAVAEQAGMAQRRRGFSSL